MKDQYKTDVIFRVDTTKDFKGQVFAVLPHNVDNYRGDVTTYQHVGQHSSGDYGVCIKTSRLAKENEYNDLKKEMENHFGYNLNIMKRRNYDKYLREYKSVNGWKN